MSDPILEAILDDSKGAVAAAVRESRKRIARRRTVGAAAILLAGILPAVMWLSNEPETPVKNAKDGIPQFSTTDISPAVAEFRSGTLEARISLFSTSQVGWAFHEIDEPALLDLLSDYRPLIVRLGDRSKLLLLQETP